MRTTTVEKLSELQRNPGNVRNICILAHVDHGKTTLADALVASNGIISQRMAGKLRYMDSREDEQVRGITMKSSAISLHYQQETEEYLVNLIDSPGHVDFSSEVSTAVRLCDGAIVMVDVVEGVCPQTHAVLRQAWLENIRPILVLNKIDRLITELKMETLQAFIHLQQILEQVNLVTSELFTADMMSMQSSEDTNGISNQQTHDWTEDADELEDRNIYFSPDQGNVVFASALDGWGFTIGQFAELYSKKLGISETGLKRTLWGDYYLNMKTKRVTKGAQSKGKKPLFVQFVLENIWSVYDAVMERRDKEMIEKIVKSLNLKIALRDSRHADPRVQLTAITSQWLPVSKAVLSVVVEKLPSPLSILEDKVEKLMCSQAKRFDSLPEQTQKLKQDFLACSDKDDVPVIVFVSKMVPVEKKLLPANKQRQYTEEELQKRYEEARLRHAARQLGTRVDTDIESQGTSNNENKDLPSKSTDGDTDNGEDHVFVAFARVFSGTVRQGQKLYVLGPKHDPAKALQEMAAGGHIDSSAILEDLASDQHVTMVTVKNLYLFMGRELESLDAVPAGNVLGIGGLEDHILNSGTVSSTVACPAFTDLFFEAFPILRVALEPTQAGDMKHLIRGLKLLNQADPCVQMLVQESGEVVIITAGEVHLRKCLDDLRDRYAKIEITASKPIVPFRETIIPPPKIDMVNESIQDLNQITRNERWKEFEADEEVLEEGLVRIFTPSKNCMVQIRAKPLPPKVTELLESNQFLIKTLDQYVSAKIVEKTKSRSNQRSELKDMVREEISEFREKLDIAFTVAGKKWKGFVDQIWAFGPRRVGPNLLINKVEGYDRISFWNCLRSENSSKNDSLRDFDYSVMSGFQLATLTGPLCDEPLMGVCFIVEKWEILTESDINKAETDIETASGQKELHSPSQSLDSQLENVTLEDISNEGQGQPKPCDTQESSLDQSGSISQSCDPEGENEKSDQVPPIVSRRKRQRSCRVSESGSIHDLEVETAHDLDLDSDSDEESDSSKRKTESQGHVSGQLIGIVKDCCLKAFRTQPQRLMLAMYKCTVQCTTEALGKLYAVIGKRQGKINAEYMVEGTQMFSIEAFIPVVESFGFSEELRKKTSGLASPQLVFSHWETLDVDPYWVPRTEEEIMHYGDKADTENRALTYMNNVRDRKGLKVDKKIVEHAEKQRTLTKNK